jgi:hypothetical protein
MYCGLQGNVWETIFYLFVNPEVKEGSLLSGVLLKQAGSSYLCNQSISQSISQSVGSLASEVSEQNNVSLQVAQMSYPRQKNINYKIWSATLR